MRGFCGEKEFQALHRFSRYIVHQGPPRREGVEPRLQDRDSNRLKVHNWREMASCGVHRRDYDAVADTSRRRLRCGRNYDVIAVRMRSRFLPANDPSRDIDPQE